MISKIWPTEISPNSRAFLVYHGFIEHVFNDISFLLRRKLNGVFTQKLFQNMETLKGKFLP